jgi:hypothetical protein
MLRLAEYREVLLDQRSLRLFACDCVERILPLTQSMHPEDPSPRHLIEVARCYLEGKASSEDLIEVAASSKSVVFTATPKGEIEAFQQKIGSLFDLLVRAILGEAVVAEVVTRAAGLISEAEAFKVRDRIGKYEGGGSEITLACLRARKAEATWQAEKLTITSRFI